MADYRLDIREILEEVGGGVHVQDALEIDQLVVGFASFTMRGAPRFAVSVSNAGEGIVAIGSISARVVATCSRCLAEFDMDIVGDVEGFWLRPGDEAPDDTEVCGSVDAEGAIDLAPALISALVVEAPFAPLHDEDCAGLCLACGVDLNTQTCSCADTDRASHPFAALEGLLGNDEEAAR